MTHPTTSAFHTLTDVDWERELKRARAVKNDISEQIKAMLKYIQYQSQSEKPDYYDVYAYGNLFIGKIMMDPDGFYYFFPEYTHKGCMWSSAMMKDLVHKLEALNEAETQRQLKEAIEPGSHEFTD